MTNSKRTITVVGGGLAGCECALQLADMGYPVVLLEMRGSTMTPAHKTGDLAELVCSNSFGSKSTDSAPGHLKWEAQELESHILKAAYKAEVPAGQALGIDRTVFSSEIRRCVEGHPNITLQEKLVTSLEDLPRPAVIATGPLTHENLAKSLQTHFGDEFLYFFDAIAPIVDADSINMDIAFKADRYGKGDGDYINCPLNKDEYYAFIEAVKAARKIEPKEFEKDTPFFEGCMPIEAMVERGDRTLAFGPMKPVGIDDPRTGRWPYAVVQLRQENKEGTCYNLVGFQTKMAYPDQKRVFSMIPGLENAEFLKLGSIHRNLFVNSPKRLNRDLSSKKDPLLFFAGQITGVEGYFESTSIGLLVARFIDQKLSEKPFSPPPRETALGSLLYAITGEEKENFQPTNINFGLLPVPTMDQYLAENPCPKPPKKIPRKDKRALMLATARKSFRTWKESLD